jgi:hypothetical protein
MRPLAPITAVVTVAVVHVQQTRAVAAGQRWGDPGEQLLPAGGRIQK